MGNSADIEIIAGGLGVALAACVMIVSYVRGRTGIDKVWHDDEPHGLRPSTLWALLLAAAGFALIVYGAIQLLKV